MSDRLGISTFLGIAAAVVLATDSHAADIFVPGGEPTIQAGIDAANPGDVVIVAQGEYFENINFNGKAITVRSTDPNDAGVVLNTIINGGGSGSVVTCNSGEGADTVLSGFVITGGNASGGGGMSNRTSSSPTVTNCSFSGNTASGLSGGGGMFNDVGSSPTVTNCSFSGNTATAGDGGGMSNTGSNPTVTNCTFGGNSASGVGGGMSNFSSNPTVTNCSFSGNTASSGGGMANDVGSLTVTNCSFSGNLASSFGGGMFNLDSSPTLTDGSFTGNSAISGAGMLNNASSPTVTNCTFSGNTGTVWGTMANIDNSNPTVTNCSFTGNTAGLGGGMFNDGSSPTVTNCILWNNSPDQIFGPGLVAYSDVQGGFAGIGNINADPLFVDADGPDNIPGTDDDDLHLPSGSPCIDAADNTAVPAGITTDLDGKPRFVDDPDTPDTGNGAAPIVDMGAYELQPPCPQDINGDGVINVLDLIDLLLCFGLPAVPGCKAEDINEDGTVNVLDLIELLLAFGTACP